MVHVIRLHICAGRCFAWGGNGATCSVGCDWFVGNLENNRKSTNPKIQKPKPKKQNQRTSKYQTQSPKFQISHSKPKTKILKPKSKIIWFAVPLLQAKSTSGESAQGTTTMAGTQARVAVGRHLERNENYIFDSCF